MCVYKKRAIFVCSRVRVIARTCGARACLCLFSVFVRLCRQTFFRILALPLFAVAWHRFLANTQLFAGLVSISLCFRLPCRHSDAAFTAASIFSLLCVGVLILLLDMREGSETAPLPPKEKTTDGQTFPAHRQAARPKQILGRKRGTTEADQRGKHQRTECVRLDAPAPRRQQEATTVNKEKSSPPTSILTTAF